jgi:hypothetical protein
MTVEQLMAALSKMPKSRLVLVDGYEDGFDDPIIRDEIRVRTCSMPLWWRGKYQRGEPGRLAVVIGRRNAH